jgi:hypothetical protein
MSEGGFNKLLEKNLTFKMMNNYTNPKTGHYLGTEIDEKWWRRYRKDGLFARGNGEYWIANNYFCFRRYLTTSEIVIPLKEVQEIKTGKWHSGKWAGGALVIKLLWIKNGLKLSSGFVVSQNLEETNVFIETIKKINNN